MTEPMDQPQPVPFQGETMTCVCCGKTQQSDPGISSDWRAVDADGVRYYACPDEFPPDGATTLEFELAYTVFFRNIMTIRSASK